MIRNILESINGVDIYPIVSLVIFFTLFTMAVIYALSVDKKIVLEMEKLPLDSKESEHKIGGLSYEK